LGWGPRRGEVRETKQWTHACRAQHGLQTREIGDAGVEDGD
jgi:hypothetical protein